MEKYGVKRALSEDEARAAERLAQIAREGELAQEDAENAAKHQEAKDG